MSACRHHVKCSCLQQFASMHVHVAELGLSVSRTESADKFNNNQNCLQVSACARCCVLGNTWVAKLAKLAVDE